MRRKALITGVLGQDGSYLAEFLSAKGYEVHGTCRVAANIPSYLERCCSNLYEIDLEKPGILKSIILRVLPDEIYHLAAHHFSSQKDGNSKNSFTPFNAINLSAANDILECISKEIINCRFFYASSCQVFGKVDSYPQNEQTPYNPDSFYSIAKAAATQLCKFYREKEGIYVSVGILYNHESERRGAGFITTEIANAAAQASLGLSVRLVVRDLDAIVDWGAARDYIEAMWLTLQQTKSDDYIIASGTLRTVRDFAKAAFECVNLNFAHYVLQDETIVRKQRQPFIGDPSKIKLTCNWQPRISFKELVKEMVQSRINVLKQNL